jgi:AcrR family transcriptional regulator
MARAVTHDRLYAAALDLIDRDGLDALSMRKLGAELGVEAASLYHHVENKAALLDGVLASLWVDAPSSAAGEGGWKRRLREIAQRIWALCREHPHLAPALAARGPSGPAYFELAEAALRALREADFDELEAARAMAAVQSYALGAAAASSALPLAVGPYAAVAAAAVALESSSPEASFAWGLEALIRGVAKMRDR